MYRTLIALIVMIISFYPCSVIKAENRDAGAFRSMSTTINLGIGNDLKKSSGELSFPLIWGGVEYNIQKEPYVPLSFGGVFGYASYEEDVRMNIPTIGTYTFEYSYSYYILGARTAYHFTPFIKVKDLDIYAGFHIGYVFVQTDVNKPSGIPDVTSKEEGNYTIWGFYGGARYFITDTIGAFLEFGAVFYRISGGVSYRL